MGRAACTSSLLLPGENMWSRPARGFLYLLCMLYIFAGINVVADRFMLSIERITSRAHFKPLVDPETGLKSFVVVKGWNDMVAGLTLMAVGTSAPEIMLALVETLKTLGQPADQLGPGTIVGSASYNFMIISALAMVALPRGHISRINNFKTFLFTAVVSIWAYIWVLIILKVSSPGRIEVWEALVTLGHQPFFVFFAFQIDTDFAQIYRLLGLKRRPGSGALSLSAAPSRPGSATPDFEMPAGSSPTGGSPRAKGAFNVSWNPMYNVSDQGELPGQQAGPGAWGEASESAAMLGRKSAVVNPDRIRFYLAALERINKGKGRRWRQNVMGANHPAGEDLDPQMSGFRCYVRLSLGRQVAKSNVLHGSRAPKVNETFAMHLDMQSMIDLFPKLVVEVVRQSGPLKTEELLSEGAVDLLEFLLSPNSGTGSNNGPKQGGSGGASAETVDPTPLHLVDEHSPETSGASIQLEMPPHDVRAVQDSPISHATGAAVPTAMAMGGSASQLAAPTPTLKSPRPSRTPRDTPLVSAVLAQQAQAGSGYAPTPSIPIEVPLTMASTGEQQGTVHLTLSTVRTSDNKSLLLISVADAADLLPLDEMPRDAERKELLLIGTAASLKKGALRRAKTVRRAAARKLTTWQIFWDRLRKAYIRDLVEALSLPTDVDEDGNDRPPTFGAMVIHMVMIPWQFLFTAIILPADADGCGGWLSFVISLGTITAICVVLGEIATLFGCVAGLSSYITGVSIVALGTSVPDTLASMIAARSSPVADAAIGNITGSNACNVFLGLGISWSIAAIYCATTGKCAASDRPGNVAYFEAKAPGFVPGVTYFSLMAAFCTCLLLYRRRTQGGELGGNKRIAGIHAAVLISMWVIYLVLVGAEVWKI